MNTPCKVMGIVNVTPDSFSDGGRFFSPDEAVRRARNLADEGADILDIGGESTRPGATPLAWADEWARIEPVLKALLVERPVGVPVSVDTYHPETAARALRLGAHMVNCVADASVPDMLRLLADAAPTTELVVPAASLAHVTEAALLPRLYIDPLIGFGTATREEDLALLRSVPELARRGRVMVGVSRKRLVKRLTGEKVTGKNLGGSLGLAVWCALNGASAVRVHDVRETVQALRACAAIAEAS